MPGALPEIDKLDQLPAALDQQMRRDFRAAYLREKRVLVPIQAIGEQALNAVAAKLARWQGDIVDDQQIGGAGRWPGTEVGGTHPPGLLEPALLERVTTVGLPYCHAPS